MAKPPKPAISLTKGEVAFTLRYIYPKCNVCSDHSEDTQRPATRRALFVGLTADWAFCDVHSFASWWPDRAEAFEEEHGVSPFTVEFTWDDLPHADIVRRLMKAR